MHTVAWIVFCFSALALAYVYVGYPLLTAVLARLFPRPVKKGDYEPTVSLVILAYNEEVDIADKLENSLTLDYPPEKLEIVVASDGSTDRTDEIVRGFADRGVVLFRADHHPGKTGTTNLVVPETTGDVLVFSDATGQYATGAIRSLVRNLADPDVGGVSGRVTYDYGRDGGSASAGGFRAYQRVVVFARESEGHFGTETSTSGSITAIRRELFRAIPDTLDFDVCHPLHCALAGKRLVYEAGATSGEEARQEARSEFGARVRMAIFAYTFVPYLLRHLPAVRLPVYVFQILSHKLMRWLSPFLLISLLATSIFLAPGSLIASWAFIAQMFFYTAAAAAQLVRGPSALARALGFPLFFTTVNLAFLTGAWRYLRGERIGPWEAER